MFTTNTVRLYSIFYLRHSLAELKASSLTASASPKRQKGGTLRCRTVRINGRARQRVTAAHLHRRENGGKRFTAKHASHWVRVSLPCFASLCSVSPTTPHPPPACALGTVSLERATAGRSHTPHHRPRTSFRAGRPVPSADERMNNGLAPNRKILFSFITFSPHAVQLLLTGARCCQVCARAKPVGV